jgi:anti-sigma B factor antagonist
MGLEISEQRTNNVQVIKLAGSLSIGEEAGRLRARFKELLSDGTNRLVLDLSQLSYVDSSGLGALVAGFTTARTQGGDVKLAQPRNQLREQLTVTKLDTVFEVHASVEDAIRAFGETP